MIWDFPEYVKGYQVKFLQQLQGKPRIKFGFSVMDVVLSHFVEYSHALLKDYDYIYLFDIAVGKKCSLCILLL